MNSGANAGEPDRRDDPPGSQNPRPSGDDDATGFPGLRTWRAVYVFVLTLFAVYILLLIALERMFS